MIELRGMAALMVLGMAVTEINRALAEPAVRESFLQSALEPVGGTAAQFARLVRDDYDKYARLVQQLNIKVN